MRIAIDVRSLMEGRHSGIEEYTIQIIRALVKVSPQHTYHLFYNSARPVRLPELPNNVQVHAYRYPNKFFRLAQLLFAWPKWDELVEADVFFVTSAGLMPLRLDTPRVTVAHDLSFERFPEFLTLWRRIWHWLMGPRTLMRNSDHVIAVSEHTKDDLIRLYDMSDKDVSVVHSGVSSLSGKARGAEVTQVRRKYNLPERFALSFGRREPRKNVAGVVRAFVAIANDVDQHLVIAGESGWKQSGVHQDVYDVAVAQRIHEIGFVEEEDKAALYAAADLLVYPSFYEGFGLPPLEALVAGTPVVTSFNSALPEVVGRWATLVDPYDTAQLAAVMRELLQSAQRVPEEWRREVREVYSWDEAARKTIEILERVS